MKLGKTSKVLGVGAIAACGVCLVPLAVPFVVGSAGLGLTLSDAIVAGVGVIGIGGYLFYHRYLKTNTCC